MTEYVTLLGAEDVKRAASSMRESAMQMRRAADTMQAALEQHTRTLDALLFRWEAQQLLEKLDD